MTDVKGALCITQPAQPFTTALMEAQSFSVPFIQTEYCS